jgi:hypothetical protein
VVAGKKERKGRAVVYAARLSRSPDSFVKVEGDENSPAMEVQSV